jgi:molybdopterin molybdotransferase
MISVGDALSVVLENCPTAEIEQISLDTARGRTLAEPIRAERDFPPFDRVTMDGIAINFSSFKSGQREFKIAGVAPAGGALMTLADLSDCLEVMTGAMLPTNCDTVIRYEDLAIEEGKARITIEHIRLQQNVHFQGSDRKRESLLMDSGKIIGAPELAVLATCGKSLVSVYKTPKVAIVSSGDELIDVDQQPLPHQIRKSNNYSISGALAQFNCDVTSFHLLDDPVAIKKELAVILQDFDVVVLSGGVSMGKFDYIPDALTSLGVEKLFHKVAQRPGKPFWFGRTNDNKAVFALPGNPVSSFMCTNRYVISWMRKHLGLSEEILYAELSSDVHFKPDLTYFAQVKLSYSMKGITLATPIEGNGSGDLANLTDSDAFMCLPRGQNEFKKGSVFQILKYSLVIIFIFCGQLWI